MSEEKEMVPKLRFPEFRQAGGWTPKRLKDACEVNPANSALPGRFVYVDLESVEAGKLITRKIIDKDEAPSRAQRLLQLGDVIFQIVRPYQRNNFHLKADEGLGYVASTGYAQLRAKDSAEFLFQAVHGDDFVDRVIAKCTGSSYPAINSSDLADVPLAIPQPAEQQKIADCLSSLDELIAAQASKIDVLKTHKKGLMQQLFPREGETQPRLRFPEFRDTGEWEKTTIGDLRPFVTSGSRGWAPFYAEQGELFVRMTNLWRDSIYLDLTDSKFVQLPPGANEGVRTQLKEHDVLISITADIGIIGYVDELVPSPAYINQHIALVRFDARHLCGKYVAYFLASEESQRLFRASTDTGTKAGMSLIGIQKVELMLPGLPEQRRIADCLTGLDTLITATTQELETLKTHKKGLMQQLFPSAQKGEE